MSIQQAVRVAVVTAAVALIIVGCQARGGAGFAKVDAGDEGPGGGEPIAKDTSDSESTKNAAVSNPVAPVVTRIADVVSVVSEPISTPAATSDDVTVQQFKRKRGQDRIAEARALFESRLPHARILGRDGNGVVRDFDSLTFEMSRDELLTLLGEPDRVDDTTLAYDLGQRHGRRHTLQVQVVDGRVASSNLMVWF